MDQAELEISEGVEAQSLLNNPVLQKALDICKKEATNRMVSSSAPDREGRETAYFMLKAIEAFEIRLRSIVSNGQMAQQRVEKARKVAQVQKRQNREKRS